MYTASRSMQCRRWDVSRTDAARVDGKGGGDSAYTAVVTRTWKPHQLPVNDIACDASGELLVRYTHAIVLLRAR